MPFQQPLRRSRRSVANRIESYFCRFAVARQPISVLVIVQTASTERRFHQYRSHAQRQLERQRRKGIFHVGLCNVILPALTEFLRNFRNGNGRTATEGWKPGITYHYRSGRFRCSLHEHACCNRRVFFLLCGRTLIYYSSRATFLT